jgi:hypothetical protein
MDCFFIMIGMADVVDLSDVVDAPQAEPIEEVHFANANAAQGNGVLARLT